MDSGSTGIWSGIPSTTSSGADQNGAGWEDRSGRRVPDCRGVRSDPNLYVDIKDLVIRLSLDGFTLVQRRMGIEVARLNHDFAAVDGGASYFSTLTIGASMPAVRSLLNRFLHSFVFTEQWGAPGCATTSRKSAPSNTSCRGSIRVSGGTMCLAAIAARHCSRPIDHSNV